MSEDRRGVVTTRQVQIAGAMIAAHSLIGTMDATGDRRSIRINPDVLPEAAGRGDVMRCLNEGSAEAHTSTDPADFSEPSGEGGDGYGAMKVPDLKAEVARRDEAGTLSVQPQSQKKQDLMDALRADDQAKQTSGEAGGEQAAQPQP